MIEDLGVQMNRHSTLVSYLNRPRGGSFRGELFANLFGRNSCWVCGAG